MTADVLDVPDEERRTRRRSSDITTGLILVTLGLAFLGQRFDLTPEINMHRSWPAFLLIPGLVIWLMHRSSGWFGRGLWWSSAAGSSSCTPTTL